MVSTLRASRLWFDKKTPRDFGTKCVVGFFGARCAQGLGFGSTTCPPSMCGVGLRFCGLKLSSSLSRSLSLSLSLSVSLSLSLSLSLFQPCCLCLCPSPSSSIQIDFCSDLFLFISFVVYVVVFVLLCLSFVLCFISSVFRSFFVAHVQICACCTCAHL